MLLNTQMLAPLALALVHFSHSLPSRAPSSSTVLSRSNSSSLSDVVAWDSNSLLARGERVFIWSGEFHPFRLNSPGLWLDVFQKIKALGYTAVSFYMDWALLEGEPGHFRANGIFDVGPFMDAAGQAGLYLIARPGPYINAEVSGGGLPGWLARIRGGLRLIEPHLVSNGGPVILYQIENEYSLAGKDYAEIATRADSDPYYGLSRQYMADLEDVTRSQGIVVPFDFNDAFARGLWAPGQGEGSVDIYANDGYPFGYGSTCEDPYNWPADAIPIPSINRTQHEQFAPSNPFAIAEFQGGNPQGWGGVRQNVACAEQFNHEWTRMFYRAAHASALPVFSTYMVYGGTNWGNLGKPEGVTSYNQGSLIREDRAVVREKYSEVKLQTNFLRVSPAYLTSRPTAVDVAGDPLSTKDLTVSILKYTESMSRFYFVRHTDYTSTAVTPYRINFSTSEGNISVPQLGQATLSLHGRDSKIHVTDYIFGNTTLLYSTAEVFSWASSGNRTVLLLYGGEAETHELALPKDLGMPHVVAGNGPVIDTVGHNLIVQWTVQPQRRILKFENGLEVYLLWRNDAYNYWVLEDGYTNFSNERTIIKAGYLMRTAPITNGTIQLTGDLNATTDVEIIAAPESVNRMSFNGHDISCTNHDDRLAGTVHFNSPDLRIPNLGTQSWRFLDSLPEISPRYDDSRWLLCNLRKSSNTIRNLTTPVSLYSADYGYHAGSFMHRGHFRANGRETTLALLTQGGLAYGATVWLDDRLLGSWPGNAEVESYTQMLELPSMRAGEKHVFTVPIDMMGYEDGFLVGSDDMKSPRGTLDFNLTSHDKRDVTWRMTGNLGGEHYRDLARGPLNEGATFAERSGFHLPEGPVDSWEVRAPLKGIDTAGVGFFYTTFPLDYALRLRHTNVLRFWKCNALRNL